MLSDSSDIALVSYPGPLEQSTRLEPVNMIWENIPNVV